MITAYNTQKYVPALVASLARQTVRDWRAVFVDDASTDSTLRRLKSQVASSALTEKLVVVENPQRRYKARNVYHALKTYGSSEDIVVMLDGDDWLAHESALEILSKEYQRGWDVVWSNWRGSDGAAGSSYHLNPLISPRLQPFVTSHLFSFKKSLFDAVEPADLQDDAGAWFEAGCDVAVAWPVLEQTVRRKHIENVLYVYNRENPLNTDKIGQQYREYANEAQVRNLGILRRRRGNGIRPDWAFVRTHYPYFLKSAFLSSRLWRRYLRSYWASGRLRGWLGRRRQTNLESQTRLS